MSFAKPLVTIELAEYNQLREEIARNEKQAKQTIMDDKQFGIAIAMLMQRRSPEEVLQHIGVQVVLASASSFSMGTYLPVTLDKKRILSL
jgi:hypothetical protein